MNKTMMRGKWRQARGGVKFEWGRLTDNERRMIDGKIDQIVGVLQERYGYTQERAVAALRHYLGTHAKKPTTPQPMVASRSVFIGAAIGLAMLAAAGWMMFVKLFVDQQPALFEPEEEKSVDPMAGLFEPDNFEVEMMGYEGALD